MIGAFFAAAARRLRCWYYRQVIAYRQAQLDSIAMQRANDDLAERHIQHRLERTKHKARALRTAA